MATEQVNATNKDMLSAMEVDVIGEVMNISMGAAATAVSAMLDKQVTITTPALTQTRFGDVDYSEMDPAIMVKISYVEGINGTNVIVFRSRDMQIILNLLMGLEDPPDEDASFDFDDMTLSAACEVMNQMMGSSATALSEVLGRSVNISTPTAHLSQKEMNEIHDLMEIDDDEMVSCISFNIMVEDIMDSNFISYLTFPLARDIISSVMPEEAEAASAPEPVLEAQPAPAPEPVLEAQPAPEPEPVLEAQPVPEPEPVLEAQPAPEPEPVLEAQPAPPPEPVPQPAPQAPTAPPPQPAPQAPPAPPPQPAPQAPPQMQQTPAPPQDPYRQGQQMSYGYAMDDYGQQRMVNMVNPMMNQLNIRRPQYPDFSEQTKKALADSSNFSLLMGVPLEVSIVIGKTRRKIKDILEFGQGTVLELEKQTGAPAEVIVNGQLLAYGDVIVIGDNFGVRITEIVGTKELMDSLDSQ